MLSGQRLRAAVLSVAHVGCCVRLLTLMGGDPAGGEGSERRERGERSEPCSRRGADAKALFIAALLSLHSVVVSCALRGAPSSFLPTLRTATVFNALPVPCKNRFCKNAQNANMCLKYGALRVFKNGPCLDLFGGHFGTLFWPF